MVELIDEARDFVNKVYLPDTLTIARFYKDWATKGEGLGNFLSIGDFPQTSANDVANLFYPRGAMLNHDLSVVHPVDLEDPNQVQEFVSHSWYDYNAGKDTPCTLTMAKPSLTTPDPRHPTTNLI